MNHLELKFTDSGSANWSLFENNTELANIIRVASRKMMGDFLQELNSIVVNGGFTIPPNSYRNNVLLTNGDQPSTVRSAYLLLHKKGRGDINKKAAVSFITTAQGFLYHDDDTLSSPDVSKNTKTRGKLKGGKSRKPKRRTYKKKLMKTRRRKKTIRYKK